MDSDPAGTTKSRSDAIDDRTRSPAASRNFVPFRTTVPWNVPAAFAFPVNVPTLVPRLNVTVTFAPGETTQYVEIEVLGDTVDEPPLLYGEWGIVSFSNPVNATLDTSGFWGLGLFIIIDDD